MSIIEQAAKRLEELRRAGVDVPWAAAGLSEAEYEQLTRSGQAQGEESVAPAPAATPARGGPRLVEAAPTVARPAPTLAAQRKLPALSCSARAAASYPGVWHIRQSISTTPERTQSAPW